MYLDKRVRACAREIRAKYLACFRSPADSLARSLKGASLDRLSGRFGEYFHNEGVIWADSLTAAPVAPVSNRNVVECRVALESGLQKNQL